MVERACAGLTRGGAGWGAVATAIVLLSIVLPGTAAAADDFLPAEPVELQPLLSATGRLVEALDVVEIGRAHV